MATTSLLLAGIPRTGQGTIAAKEVQETAARAYTVGRRLRREQLVRGGGLRFAIATALLLLILP